jgi:DNA polymerase-3 subunit gamma/tau
MTYQVLARKWRPKDFSEVVGQKPIVTALSNALAEGRIAQAYLFSGIRGVGKTSVARIFAKCLNCNRGSTATPCGECSSCTEIASGANPLDVIEVDAATYSKVEQVRELTESLKYGPARDAYKVVIIDEIHRLSRQAFDALLKIVEEPPRHLVFIFATTEIESVPATILSRCQEFRFHRVSSDELVDLLERVASAESIAVGPTALRLIARASDGSVRDAVALLDQLATFGSGRIEDDAAAGILGGVDSKLFLSLLKSILESRSVEVSSTVREIEEQGWDPRYVFNEFLQYCRSALHLSLGAQADQIDLPREESAALAALATSRGYENLLRLLHLLLASEETVRRSENGLLAVEIAWLRGAELPKLLEIEAVLGGATPPPAASQPRSENGGTPEVASTGTISKARRPRRAPQATADPPPHESSGAEPGAEGDKDGERQNDPASALGSDKEAFLARVSGQSQALAAHLAGALNLDFEDGQLEISVPEGDTWIRERLESRKHRATLEKAIAATWGDPPRWSIVERAVASPQSSREEEAVVDDPEVQKILDIFGGSVESTTNGDQ